MAHLFRGEVQVLPEGEPQHVQVLSAVAEGRQDMAEHLPILHVLRIYQHHAI